MATHSEFTSAMAYLTLATGKGLPVKGKDDSFGALDVYFDLLKDLSAEVLAVAVRRVALEHKWSNFPTPAEIREAASETIQGQIKELSSAEAWEQAWRAVGRIDLEIEGSLARHTQNIPALVLEAMRAFGIPDMVYSKSSVSVIRGQFVKIYEQLASRDRRQKLFPKKLVDRIENSRTKEVVGSQLDQIGMMK